MMDELTRKEKVTAFLKSFETADITAFKYISPDYIQHNLRVTDGINGLNALFEKLPQGVKVNIIRIFEDGDYVVTHSEYFFTGWRTGFDVFRFENGMIAEHWDNLQAKEGPNISGHTMIDGPTEVKDLGETLSNKNIIQNHLDDVINGRIEKLPLYYDNDNYIQHNPWLPDQFTGMINILKEWARQGLQLKYRKNHKIIGEGSFVLAISEGEFKGASSAFFDLYRLENGKIAEHWDTIEEIPAAENHKNANGKF